MKHSKREMKELNPQFQSQFHIIKMYNMAKGRNELLNENPKFHKMRY